MSLPKDPVMLLSVVNTQLRDIYPSLDELAKAHMVEKQELIDRLEAINYSYDEAQNQFVKALKCNKLCSRRENGRDNKRSI